MTAKQVMRLLVERHALKVSYASVLRYIGDEFNLGKPEATVRLETEPGEEAQVDFGYVGRMRDPESGKDPRKTWCFVMTLSHSRHRFVRFVFRQDSPTWIDCHIRAFEFFHGVVKWVIMDNLKSGVVKPDLYDPRIHRAYANLERHYEFAADPAGEEGQNTREKLKDRFPWLENTCLPAGSSRTSAMPTKGPSHGAGSRLETSLTEPLNANPTLSLSRRKRII